MAIKDAFKVSRKTFFNPSVWLDLASLRFLSAGIWRTVKPLFSTPKEVNPETFAQAQVRMGVSDEDLKHKEQNFLFYSYLFVFCAVLTLFYTIYLIVHHHALLGFCLGLSVVAVFLAQAFRFNFWAFQIKHKKLGCTAQEWWSGQIDSSSGPQL